MSTASLSIEVVPIDAAKTANNEDLFDLDLAVATNEVAAGPTITSWFVCTPGCTSPGGGSFCSWCC